MRLLLLTEFFPVDNKMCFTGGVEARTFFIAKRLSKKNKVLLIYRKSKANISANFTSVFQRLIFILTAFFKALRLDFDLVEGSNFVTFLPALLAAKIKNKPAVAWYADLLGKDWFKYFGITGLFGFLMEKISLVLPWTRVIALSQSTKRKLMQKGIDNKKIDLVYGGVDLKEFNPLTNQLELKNRKNKNIICIARLVKYKRIDDLILSFAQLSKKYTYLRLTIVGQGPEEKKLKNLVKEKGLPAKVQFFKNLERKKLIKLLKQSYIFCLPSVIEGFGLVTIEAAAAGLPYVIADIEVNREISLGEQGGFLFKKQNIDDLTVKIEKLLLDKKLYQRKQKQALGLAKKYSWDKIVLETKKVYLKALNE